jgi:capsid protein
VRRSVDTSLKRATTGTRFDAEGQLSRRDMTNVQAAHCILTGDAFSIRKFLPGRPGRQYQGTCWLLIHSSRVSNPGFGANTETLYEGIQLDPQTGAPVGIWVLRQHPASRRMQDLRWAFVPFFDPQTGQRVVTHLKAIRTPGQRRGTGWFSPVMQLLRMHGGTLEAKVVADRLKASMGFIVECDDPVVMAKKDRNGVALGYGTTKIMPGKTHYVKKGTKWQTLNFQYQGQDFGDWSEVLMRMVCASFSIPWELVMRAMTKSNMASSRVALMTAYQTFHGLQNWLIDHVEAPWNESVITEDLARGRIILPPGIDGLNQDVIDRIFTLRYGRPARPRPDPVREAQGAILENRGLKRSLTSIHGEMGTTFEDEARQESQDEDFLREQGLSLTDGKADASLLQAPGGVPADQQEQPGEDDEKPKRETQPAGGKQESDA